MTASKPAIASARSNAAAPWLIRVVFIRPGNQREWNVYTQYPFYGSRRITVELRDNRQINVTHETVQHYMREMEIAAIYPGPNLSRRHPEHKIYPYLRRNVTTSHPNHVWGIDIT